MHGQKLHVFFIEPTCADARWAPMHRFLSVWTGPKFKLEKKSLDKKSLDQKSYTLLPTADIYQLNQQIYLMILAGGLTSTSSCIFQVTFFPKMVPMNFIKQTFRKYPKISNRLQVKLLPRAILEILCSKNFGAKLYRKKVWPVEHLCFKVFSFQMPFSLKWFP